MKIARMGLILFAWSVLSGALLALVFKTTGAHIEKTKQAKVFSLQKEILPRATEFVEDKATGVVTGYGAAHEVAGRIVRAAPKGYAGPIEMLVGISAENSVTAVRVLSHAETPGLGSQAAQPSFLGQFRNLTADRTALKKDNPAGGIDGITGATISSRAVTEGVREAFGKAGPGEKR